MSEPAVRSPRLRAVSSAERVPPHNLEAEQALLGSMFLSPDAVEIAASTVAATDFYRPAHARIFAAMEHLYERGLPVDHVSVADRLEAVDELEQSGGKPYLLDITQVVPTAANALRYAQIVKRTSMLRQLITAATQIVTIGFEAPDDIDQVIEDAERLIYDVTSRRVESNFKRIDDLLQVGFHQLEELFERKEHVTGVPTGFKDLDKLLAGLHAGDLCILAARPSVGKTALALNMAINAAKRDTSVALFSLEMSAEQLVQRLLCAEARINLQDVRTGYVKEQDWGSIHQAMGRLAELDFWVDDTPSISIFEVRTKARRQLKGKQRGLVVVDYLQLMQPPSRRSDANRTVEIGEISRGLKILAKELGVPVLALSQLSRAVEQRAGKRPQLSDLRESGSIEQDADVVMFIDRNTDPYAEDQDGRPAKGTAELIVAKHRNGPTGSVPLVFIDRYAKFTELAATGQ